MDRSLIYAHGKALALLAAVLHRSGVVPAAELGDLMAGLSDIEDDLEQSAILAIWSDLIKDAANLSDDLVP
ncbi:MAG: hypothetical protein EOO77_04215 [Oxalobacteraceae bacterium]|nr:MAG: hypothetical protein EOO77_04215 [Oxalobacteraceae bacterium]